MHTWFALVLSLNQTQCSSCTAQQTLQGQRSKGRVKGGPAVLDNVFRGADTAACASGHDIFKRGEGILNPVWFMLGFHLERNCGM